MATTRTPREQLERAMHVSFKLPEQVREMLDAHEQQVRDEDAAERARLVAVARDALAALDDLIYDHNDPGTAALGARYLLAQELTRYPAPDAPAADPDAETLTLLRDRITAEFAREDAHHWGYDHGFCEKYGTDPATDAFVDIAVKALLGTPLAARTGQEA